MALITISDVTIGFRGPSLLDDVSCQIEQDQRIGLLGRNGAGKTTLMKLLSGELEPDSGKILWHADARVAFLPQDVPQGLSGDVATVIAEGVQIDEEQPWKGDQDVERIVTRMDLDPAAPFEKLSSGMKRRVLLARALVGEPELLLLDEPTNHLDLDAIEWMETFLSRWPATLIFVTHDRMFLRKLATRILEIEHGKLFDWSCDYDTFLIRKEQLLAAEAKQDALFDKRLAQEEIWIRQGIKARRTRNEGRVRALKKLREQSQERRKATGNVKLRIAEGQRSGNLVAEVEQVSFAYPDRPIVENFSTTIMRGDKVGIIGRNGAGKTTLLRILLGQLAPQSGSVRTGTNLEIAYFDQLRDQLNEDKTVQENVGDGYDTVEVGGKSQHVLGYLQNFLFSPERARTPVRFLSGGERNRVLLARLFSKPANTIVLDEPTNDLDTETLELLEERLVEFTGTVLLVSHDRAFLNNVVTSTIVFEEDGVCEYHGGYDDWLRQREATTKGPSRHQIRTKKSVNTGQSNPVPTAPRRLSYNEQRELRELPVRIEDLEAIIRDLHSKMADPKYFQQPAEILAADQRQLSKCQGDLSVAFERWASLEAADSVG